MIVGSEFEVRVGFWWWVIFIGVVLMEINWGPLDFLFLLALLLTSLKLKEVEEE